MIIYRKLWLILILVTVSNSQFLGNKKILCYYANWSEERNIAFRLYPKDIDATLCTHIVYAFAMPDLNDGIVPMDFLENLTDGGSVEFGRLKRLNPDLVLMLSIGGWNEGSVRFSRIASDPDKIRWFAQYACQFVRSVGFDGLDVNWQWPGLREGSNSADKSNFAAFIKAIKSYFLEEGKENELPPLLLSVVLPPLMEITTKGFDMGTIAREADFLNLHTMEYHLSTEPIINHPAPLYNVPNRINTKLTVDTTVESYLKMGINPKKMILGIPLYGQSYLLESSVQTRIGSFAEDEGIQGFGTRTPGQLAYYEICKYIKDDGWLVERPNATAMGPYAFLDKNWVAYDDSDMVRKKVQYANSKGLGGVMLWTIDLDDFKGTCKEKFPLTRAAREAIVAPGSSPSLLLAVIKQPPNNENLLISSGNVSIIESQPKVSSSVESFKEKDNPLNTFASDSRIPIRVRPEQVPITFNSAQTSLPDSGIIAAPHVYRQSTGPSFISNPNTQTDTKFNKIHRPNPSRDFLTYYSHFDASKNFIHRKMRIEYNKNYYDLE